MASPTACKAKQRRRDPRVARLVRLISPERRRG